MHGRCFVTIFYGQICGSACFARCFIHSYAKAVANVSVCVCRCICIFPVAVSISEFYVAAFATAVCISRMKFSTTNERHRHKHKHRRTDRKTDRQTKTASRQENSFCQRNSSIKHGDENNKIAEHKKYAQLKFKNSSNNAKQFTSQRDSTRTLCTDCAAERYIQTHRDTDTGMDTL